MKREEAQGLGIYLESCIMKMEEETLTREFSRRCKETDSPLKPT